jgi:ATP-dependent helicase/nuclease subunit A
LRKIFEETNFITVLASRHDADQELANIEKLLKITNTFTNQGFKTLYDYVDYLKDSISNLADEAQAGLAEQLNAVSILTLHQAKGLEFPVVFLYNSHEESKTDNVKSKSITIDKTFGLLTKVPINNDYFGDYNSAPVIGVRDYVERRKNLAEIKRLFYVGITRAEKYLFISATSKGKNKFPSASFISLLFEGLDAEYNVNNISLADDLTLLINENGNYKNVTKKLNVTIPIIQHLEYAEEMEHKSEQIIKPKSFLLDNISDKSEGEIISATKVSTYAQCPLKYNFIYNYGYSKLYSDLRKFDSKNTFAKYTIDGFDGEDSLTVEFDESPTFREHSEIKGKIIHKVLQKEVENENLENFILNEIDISYKNIFKSEETKGIFVESLKLNITRYYSSDEYRFLKNFAKYKNEIEIYLKEDDYYLFGIIDKVIITEGKIIIVDYKTDVVDQKYLKTKAEYYLNQLKFYVYIVSKLYKDFDLFEIRIVFLMFPDNPYTLTYDRNKVGELKEEILFLIKGILRAEYPQNLSHCSECNFSINNKCVL